MDPLAQLKDIHLPDPVGWWPLAWGWWVLLILIAIVVISLLLAYRQRKRRNRYRALARTELQRAKHQFEQDQSLANYLQQISIILRRTALSGCGSRYQANLKGASWLNWLDDQCPETRRGFSQGAGRALLTGPYEAKPQADVEALQQLALTWVEKHRNQWQKTPSSTPAEKSVAPTQTAPASSDKTEARDA